MTPEPGQDFGEGSVPVPVGEAEGGVTPASQEGGSATEAGGAVEAVLPAGEPERPLTRFERREKAAGDVLRALIRDLHADRHASLPPPGQDVELTLRLKAKPRDGWVLVFEPSLSEQIVQQVDESRSGRGLYCPGRVHCFRCETPECEHAVPPGPQSVFLGYGPTGLPEWHELHQAFIEARDIRVDQLFGAPPAVLALVQSGHGLRDRQLRTFGRSTRTYAILGQVVAGYLILPRKYATDRFGRVALTLQVVETRESDGRPVLKLNTLCGLPAGCDVEELLVSDWEPWILRARDLAVRALEDLEWKISSAREGGRVAGAHAILGRVPLVLRRLAECLERGYRQEQRRTRHVEDRRQDHRPVHKALDDLREAPWNLVYADEKRDTLVVCGPQGRAHAFSGEGRHVTSFVLRPDAVELRLRTQRWRPVTEQEAVELKRKAMTASRGPAATASRCEAKSARTGDPSAGSR